MPVIRCVNAAPLRGIAPVNDAISARDSDLALPVGFISLPPRHAIGPVFRGTGSSPATYTTSRSRNTNPTRGSVLSGLDASRPGSKHPDRRPLAGRIDLDQRAVRDRPGDVLVEPL